MKTMKTYIFSAIVVYLALSFKAKVLAEEITLEKSSLCLETKNDEGSLGLPRVSLSDYEDAKDEKNAKKLFIRYKALALNQKCPGGRLIVFYEMSSDVNGKKKTFLSNNVCLKDVREKSYSNKFCFKSEKALDECSGKDGGLKLSFSSVKLDMESLLEKTSRNFNVFCFDDSRPLGVSEEEIP